MQRLKNGEKTYFFKKSENHLEICLEMKDNKNTNEKVGDVL